MPTQTTPPDSDAAQTPEVQRSGERSFSERIVTIINDLPKSEAFLQARAEGKGRLDVIETAFAAKLEDPHLSERDRATVLVAQGLGTFIDGSLELTRFQRMQEEEGHRLTTNERFYVKKLKKDFVIPFNHSVKEMIDNEPNTSLPEVVKMLAGAHNNLYRQFHNIGKDRGKSYEQTGNQEDVPSISTVMYYLNEIFDSMRHEVAAETLLTAAKNHLIDKAPGANRAEKEAYVGDELDYDYDTSVEEDATGTDLKVVLDGRERNVDIKKTPNAERRAREKHPSSIKIWTGLSEANFKGAKGQTRNGLSLSYTVADQMADTFVAHLQDITYQADNQHLVLAGRAAHNLTQR